MNFTGLKWRYQPGLLEGLGKKPFPCLFSFGRLPASLCLWPLPLSAKLTSVLLQILLLSSHLLVRRWLFCLLFHLKGPLWLYWDVHMIQDNLSRKKEEKKAERQRTDAFELWCWRRLLRVPWTARSNQSILKEINPEYSLVGLMLKLNTLATWCEELIYWKRLWCWERLKAGGEDGNRRWDGRMASPTQWTRIWANSGR